MIGFARRFDPRVFHTDPEAAVPRACSIAAVVGGPTLPSATKPWADWNAFTAAAVSGPNDPSGTSGGLAPSLFNDCCTQAVLCRAGLMLPRAVFQRCSQAVRSASPIKPPLRWK